MRRRSVATVLVVLTAGLTATALRRMATRRRAAAPSRAAGPTPAPAAVPVPQPVPQLEAPAAPDAVVLQFTRPAATVPAAPARCGDSGGLTRAGAPCGGRATSGGRCHHHPIAA